MSKSPIQHLIVLMMENRSFDHMFGYMNISNPVVPGDKIDGLIGTESNPNVAGYPAVRVSADAEYAGDYRVDPSHAFVDVNVQLFGANPVPPGASPANQGFVIDYAQQPGNDPSKAGRVMKCFAPERIPVLTRLAQEFAVCDRWFASVPGPTLPNRAFAHAATSNGHVDMNPLAYFGVSTIYEALDKAGVSSKIYGFDGNTSAFMFKQLFTRGNRFLGEFDDFLDDLSGTLPSYCFIEPRFNDWYDEATDQNYVANDQHPDNNVQAGEQLIADVYEAVRASKYWGNSLLVIVYDEHGGLYDHVPPPSGVASVDPSADFDFTRLGLRVPAVLISPYIKAGTISHNQFEHSSLAATASGLFAPASTPITARAAQAKPFHDLLNLDKPRDDAPTKLNRSVGVFQSDSNSHGQGSLNEHQMMQLLAAYHFDSLQPPDKRVLGRVVPQRTLQDLGTEHVAAVYIKAVAAQASPAAFGAKA